MTIIELHARRRQNRRQMQTEKDGETLALCQRLEDVLNALIWKLSNRR
jgi:energy-converting hydrogenase A subunit M